MSATTRPAESPQPVTTSGLSTTSLVLAVIAAASLATLWAAVWMPAHLWGFEGQLLLFPLLIAAAALLALIGAVAAGVAIASIARESRSRRSVAALVIGVLVFIAALPVMWFGA